MATTKRKSGTKASSAGKKASAAATSRKTTASKTTKPSSGTGAGKKTGGPAFLKASDMTGLVDLSPEAVKGLSKPRDNFAEHFDSLVEFYQTHAATLGTLSTSVDEARARLGRWGALKPDEAAAQEAADKANKHLEMIRETRALQASTVWNTMLEIYNKGRATKNDAAIAKAIKAFSKFMAIGPHKKGE